MATTSKRAEGGILKSVQKTVAGLHRANLVDEGTMREFDSLCRRSIRTVDLTKEEIDEMLAGRMSPEHDHLNALLDKE